MVERKGETTDQVPTECQAHRNQSVCWPLLQIKIKVSVYKIQMFSTKIFISDSVSSNNSEKLKKKNLKAKRGRYGRKYCVWTVL